MHRMSVLRLSLCAIVLVVTQTAVVAADSEFAKILTRIREENGVRIMDVRIHYEFSQEVLRALNNGLPIILETQAEELEPRSMLWDKRITTTLVRREIRYHALSQQYLVRNIETDSQVNFLTLSLAIDALGAIDGLPLSTGRTDKPKRYRIRTRLDIEGLPSPLRLLAYLSKDWLLDSQWQSWPLN